MSKVDEPFDPNAISQCPPRDLEIRLATESDHEQVVDLMCLRNPFSSRENVEFGLRKEIRANRTTPRSRIFVAVREREVLALSRIFHSKDVPYPRKRFPAPEGWYSLGIIVKPNARRHGIARAVIEYQLEYMKSVGIERIFSSVDVENKASMRMHEVLGAKPLGRAPGFLQMALESGEGALFVKEL